MYCLLYFTKQDGVFRLVLNPFMGYMLHLADYPHPVPEAQTIFIFQHFRKLALRKQLPLHAAEFSIDYFFIKEVSSATKVESIGKAGSE